MDTDKAFGNSLDSLNRMMGKKKKKKGDLGMGGGRAWIETELVRELEIEQGTRNIRG